MFGIGGLGGLLGGGGLDLSGLTNQIVGGFNNAGNEIADLVSKSSGAQGALQKQLLGDQAKDLQDQSKNDALQRAITKLSNMLKKMHDTMMAVIANMR